VLRLEQEVDLHVADAGLAEQVFDDEVSRVRRPGEVVDALLLEPVQDALAGQVALFDAHSGRPDLSAVTRGNVDRDVVVAEVGEEFAGGVELVAVPAVFLEDPDLREPLRDEEEVAFATVRSFGLPSSGETYVSAGRRSLPSASIMRVSSIEPQDSGSRLPRCSPPDSCQNVESVLRNAFR
jgi:hypothetical protein